MLSVAFLVPAVLPTQNSALVTSKGVEVVVYLKLSSTSLSRATMPLSVWAFRSRAQGRCHPHDLRTSPHTEAGPFSLVGALVASHPLRSLTYVYSPKDSTAGKHIPVEQLIKYAKGHVWPDKIHCFCLLGPDGKERSVHLFIPSQGPTEGLPCLGCSDWTPYGVGGCLYFGEPFIICARRALH